MFELQNSIAVGERATAAEVSKWSLNLPRGEKLSSWYSRKTVAECSPAEWENQLSETSNKSLAL